MRRASTCLALIGLAVIGLSATASAAPTITLKARAVPIPGFPGTGNILGAGADLKTEFTISGTEYGGFPAPLTGVKSTVQPARSCIRRGSPPARKPRLNEWGPRRARRTLRPVPRAVQTVS